MAVELSCPACDQRLRVRDELAGRKVRCPKCRIAIPVPRPEHPLPEEEILVVPEAGVVERRSPPTPRRPRGDELVARPRRTPEPNRDEDDYDERPRSKKSSKKSILNQDVRELDAAFKNFDLRRFTVVGWLLFIVSVAVCIGCIVLFDRNYEQIMGALDPKDRPGSIKYVAPIAAAGAIGGLGTFFGMMGILWLFGIRVIRPKMD
jgi:hypothetical protein